MKKASELPEVILAVYVLALYLLKIRRRLMKVLTLGGSSDNFYPSPEGHIPFDDLGGFRRPRVIPGGVIIDLLVHIDIVITGHAFPGADGVRFALGKVFAVYRFRWEVMVPFRHDGPVTICQDFAPPNCPWHSPLVLPDRFRRQDLLHAVCHGADQPCF